MIRTSVTPSPCPVCDAILDAVAPLMEHKVPVPGDLTICISCGTILSFGHDIRPCLPRSGEVADVFRRNPRLAIQMKQAQVNIKRRH